MTKPPKMMPGQEPYTPDELARVEKLVSDAADSDPGETGEESCRCTFCNTPFWQLIGMRNPN